MDWFWWVFGGVAGLLGVGGLVGLLFGLPVLLAAGSFVLGIWNALPRWLKQALIAVLVLVAIVLGSYYRGDHDGAARVQALWDEAQRVALQNAHDAGAAANAAAEANVPALTPEDRAADRAIVPRVAPCRVRDPFDRSCDGR